METDVNPTAAKKAYELIATHLTPESFASSGRREFCDYRDLGVAGATHGEFGVTVTRLNADPRTTGWHYHDCQLQIVYVLQGSIDLAFEDGRVIHLEAGSSMNIPPRMLHNEVNVSRDYEVIEITRPAKITTTEVPTPIAFASQV